MTSLLQEESYSRLKRRKKFSKLEPSSSNRFRILAPCKHFSQTKMLNPRHLMIVLKDMTLPKD